MAIADQIASINHDIEDIIEESPYTEYDIEKFSIAVTTGFKERYPDSYNKLQNEVLSLIIPNSVERGYGRQKRVEASVDKITEASLEYLKKQNVSREEQAKEFPLCLSKGWSDLLRWYETFIRDLIREKVSWFIARDNMAGALISTVFNHIWPRTRRSVTITQMKLPMFEKSDLVKSKYEEKTKYIEYFANFFNEHYFDAENNFDFYATYLEKAKQMKIKTWDINILDALKQKLNPDEFKLLAQLAAVIDFVAGLTDRYCLEMFNKVYQEFVKT